MIKKILFVISLYTTLGYSQKDVNKSTGGTNNKNNFATTSSVSDINNKDNESYVDLYTGKINFSLPIFTIKESDLQLPINLSYSNDAIRVDDRASKVGLGWNLTDDNSIVRVVKGKPDEDIVGYNQYGMYYENYGRFHDLLSVSTSPQSFQFPLGNTSLSNKLSYYINILKNNTSINSKYYGNNFTCGIQSQLAMLELMIRNASDPDNTQSIVPFWPILADTQPDEFYYNISGNSGKFILDDDGNPLLLEGELGTKIIPAIGPQSVSINPKWVITLPNGVVFELPHDDNFTEKSNLKFLSTIDTHLGFSLTPISKQDFDQLPNDTDPNTPVNTVTVVDRTVINKWYISKIKLTNNREITFNYNSQGTIEDYIIDKQQLDLIKSVKDTYSINVFSNFNFESISCQNLLNRPSKTRTNVNFVTHDVLEQIHNNNNNTVYSPTLQKILAPKYLNEISFNEGKVQFLYFDTQRDDLPNNMALKEIKILNIKNELIKRTTFTYDYFLSNDFVDNEHSKRLKLIDIREVDALSNFHKYGFEYYEEFNLPSRKSFNQDFWGFYNNSDTNTSLIPSGSRSGITLNGANRNPDEGKMKTAMLKKVIFPNDGFTEFFYEINKSITPDLFNLELAIGGLRVKKIITGSQQLNTEQNTNTNFLYSNGYTVNILNYNWMRHYMNDASFSDQHYYSDSKSIKYNYYVKRSSYPVKEFIKTKGGIVGYENVTVTNTIGKKVYTFTNPYNTPDIQGVKVVLPFRNELDEETYHENLHDSKDVLRGLITEVKYYNSNNKLVKSISNEYNENPELLIPKSVTALDIKSNNNPKYGSPYNYIEALKILSFYDLKQYFPYKKSVKERSYEIANQNYLEKNTIYQKNDPNHFFISNKKEYVNNNYLESKYFYTENFSFSNTIAQSLKDKNIISTPLKTQYYRNTDKISEQETIFKDWNNGLFAPEIVKTSKGTATLKNAVKYNLIDNTNGNQLEVQQEKNYPICYIWGYNKTQIIAKIQNATYSEIQGYVSNLQDLSNGDNEASLIVALNSLRNDLPNAMVTTYTYKPLVGISTITDSKGNIMTYHYDSFNRLQFVKDSEQKIISEKEYHYKN